MTDDEKREIIDNILNDPNKITENTRESTIFNYDKILTETITSVSEGYILHKTYTWVEAYNNDNTFGGWCNINCENTLEVINIV